MLFIFIENRRLYAIQSNMNSSVSVEYMHVSQYHGPCISLFHSHFCSFRSISFMLRMITCKLPAAISQHTLRPPLFISLCPDETVHRVHQTHLEAFRERNPCVSQESVPSETCCSPNFRFPTNVHTISLIFSTVFFYESRVNLLKEFLKEYS